MSQGRVTAARCMGRREIVGRQIFVWLLVLMCVSIPAGAASLTARMTVDNSFTACISTDDSVQGTWVGSGDNWGATYTFTAGLTPGVVNYLHIVASDSGVIAGFIGDFSLSGSDFLFANGQSTLVTSSADWKVSAIGFGSNYSIPDEIGANGVSPWGYRQGISSSAKWLWTNMGNDTHSTRYFSTPIIFVPEPSGSVVFATGLIGAVGLLRLRRR